MTTTYKRKQIITQPNLLMPHMCVCVCIYISHCWSSSNYRVGSVWVSLFKGISPFMGYCRFLKLNVHTKSISLLFLLLLHLASASFICIQNNLCYFLSVLPKLTVDWASGWSIYWCQSSCSFLCIHAPHSSQASALCISHFLIQKDLDSLTLRLLNTQILASSHFLILWSYMPDKV